MQTLHLHNILARSTAKRLIEMAPEGSRVQIRPPLRTIPQNDKMWAMLSDVSRAKPDGIRKTPEVWKQLFMHALGHEVAFEMGLNGEPFPTGFRSSRLSKEQMSDLIEFIYEYGARHDIVWTEPADDLIGGESKGEAA